MSLPPRPPGVSEERWNDLVLSLPEDIDPSERDRRLGLYKARLAELGYGQPEPEEETSTVPAMKLDLRGLDGYDRHELAKWLEETATRCLASGIRETHPVVAVLRSLAGHVEDGAPEPQSWLQRPDREDLYRVVLAAYQRDRKSVV